MKQRIFFFFVALLCIGLIRPCLLLAQAPASAPAAPAEIGPLPQAAPAATPPTAPVYTLPPEKLAQAIAYSHARTFLHFASTAWTLLALLLLLAWHVPARFRDWAERCTQRRWLQGLVFLPLFLLALSCIGLPLDLYEQHLSHKYGQSVQSWGSWSGDWTKSLLLTLLIGTLLLSLFFWVVRRSPRRWWAWSWLAALPVLVFGVFISPILVDPIFYKFGPLQKTDPALVAQLEQVAARDGLHVPPSRIFLMQASEKVTGLNAYVTGLGPSKRIVVWDTTIQKATPNEILFIFGHEMGHYVLNHIYKGMAFIAGLLLVALWLCYHSVHWLVRRFGTAWQVRAVDDWAALAVLSLAFVFFSFLLEPALNSFTRVQEHHADIYGQEAIHGIVASPQRTAQHAFQLLGELSLSDPYPSRFVEFWTYSHPSIARRAAFAAHYDPWLPGQHPRYFQK
ncbi:MAG: M48 family metallopeptidase [Acidobacteriaceae bacterium]